MIHPLITKHSQLFDGKEPPSLSIPEGWIPVVDNLFGKIEEVMPGELMPHFFIISVDEKYASLRVSYQGAYTEAVEALLDEAEELSEVTCQECSDPGNQRTNGWMRCLCDFCEKERLIRANRGRRP